MQPPPQRGGGWLENKLSAGEPQGIPPPLGSGGATGAGDEGVGRERYDVSMGSWYSKAEYPDGQPNPSPIVMEEGAYLLGYCLNPAYQIIWVVYGDHLNHNNGNHLDGDMADDAV